MKKNIFFLTILFYLLAAPLFSQNTPNSVLLLYSTARSLESQGRTWEANLYYNDIIRISNDEIFRNIANRDTYTAFTWALQRLGRYNEVINWGERALRIYPDEYRIVQTMGEAYFYLNDFNNSLSFMQRYVNDFPGGDRVSIAYFFIGEIYRLQRKFYLADMALTTAVRLQPAIALWWFRLGQVRENSGYNAHAAEAYQQALALTPGYQVAIDGLNRVRR